MPKDTNVQKEVVETQPAEAQAEATQPTTTAAPEAKAEAVAEEKPAEVQEEKAPESLLGEESEVESKEETKDEDPVPEKYEFQAPEGTELDEGMIEAFSPLAKELGLGQAAAQKLVDLVATKSQEAAESQRKQEAQMITDWQKEITSDPGHKELLSNAKLTVNKFGKDNPEFDKLTKSWLGSHPGFVKFLASIGTHLKEASMDSGSVGSGGGEQSLGSILYPNMGKNK